MYMYILPQKINIPNLTVSTYYSFLFEYLYDENYDSLEIIITIN